MSHSGKFFTTLFEQDKKILELLAKGLNSPKDIALIRTKLSNLPEAALIHLLGVVFADEQVSSSAAKVKVFCQTDPEMAAIWSDRLKEKKYIAISTILLNGKTVPVFDHYFGHICYAAFMDGKVDKNERNKAIQLAAEYCHYQGLIVYAKHLITTAKAKPDSIVDLQSNFFAITSLLGEHFWSLGYFRAGRLLHELLLVCPDEKTKQVLTDAMLREFGKAKLFINSEQSLAIFQAIRGESTLSDYLESIFGVKSVAAVDELLQTNFTKEQFDINSEMAVKEIVSRVSGLLMEEEVLSAAEEKELQAEKTQTNKLQTKSMEITSLIQQSILKPVPINSQSSAVSQNSASDKSNTPGGGTL